MMKKSGSRIHVGKGSMNHIGAMPYRFRLDIFVSYVDNVKNATEVCITWERRGNMQATTVAEVKDKKAVFRQSLSMESTLFRRANNTPKGALAINPEELKFDEKKAKFLLRKGGPDGKAIGKIHINLADYVRGTTSTVFADMKLSNGSVIVTKIEATMLHMGKKKKNGSRAGSEACSETTDVNSVGDDSLFGDDDQDLGDIEIEITSGPTDEKPSSAAIMSPVSSAASSSTKSLSTKATSRIGKDAGKNSSTKESSPTPASPTSRAARKSSCTSTESSSFATPTKKASQRGVKSLKEEDDLKESPSLRNKLKGKMKGRKDKDKDKRKEDAGTSSATHKRSPEKAAEIAELTAFVESLKKENAKLKTSKQVATDEIDALHADLESCEAALENAHGTLGSSSTTSAGFDMSKTLKEKDKKIAELKAQNEALLDELEEVHEGAVDSADGVASGQINTLMSRIEDLEVALRREPQYMDVINELKVTKVSLALANMEKEQALFALQTYSAQQQTYNDSD